MTQETLFLDAQTLPQKSLSHHSYTRKRIRRMISMHEHEHDLLVNYLEKINKKNKEKGVNKKITVSQFISCTIKEHINKK